jgi:phytanoyl-CoA hydroxylase
MILPMLNPAQLEAYHRDGFVVVPNLHEPDLVEAFLAHEERQHPERNGRNPLLNHEIDPLWAKLAKHPNVAGPAQQILGGRPMIVQTMYLKKPPGAPGIALHQDTHYLPSEPNTLMACWIAFTDTDAVNGGFTVVPGTHTGPLLSAQENRDHKEHDVFEHVYDMRDRNGREWKQRMYRFQVDVPEDKIQRLTIPRGAGVFFHGMLVHGSYANHTPDRPRLAWAVHYVKEGTWLLRTDVQNTMPAA